MKITLLTGVATAALLAGSGLVFAQDSGRPHEVAPSRAPAAQQSAPAEKVAPPIRSGASTTGAASEDSKMDAPAAQSGDKANMDRSRQSQDTKSRSESSGRSSADTNGQMSDDHKASDKSRTSSDSKASDRSKMSEDSKASDKSKMSEDRKASDKSRMSNDKKASGDHNGRNGHSTTGQGAAASANLTTEQRTKITTVIKQQHVNPVTNVNFSISIGARVPRSVHLYALPSTVVEVYPEWRGYEYILAEDEILVVDPRTLEIVAVIET